MKKEQLINRIVLFISIILSIPILILIEIISKKYNLSESTNLMLCFLTGIVISVIGKYLKTIIK